MLKSVRLIVKYMCDENVIFQVRRASQTLPELSSEKYDVKRKDFAKVEKSDVDYFKSVLSGDRVLTKDTDISPFNIDWTRNCRGQSKVVLKPKTTDEVCKILSYCAGRRLAVCPQGGNTSVVGGSVPVFDEIVLSLSLMNRIISLDDVSGALVCEAGCILETLDNYVREHNLMMPVDLGAKGSCLNLVQKPSKFRNVGALVCEAGCILETLDNYVREHNLMMPVDLGAKGSCHIGGNISTNAGGNRLIRYGNLHGSLLGLEAVKADGTVIDCLKTLKKDNTGYHLKHLFVGSEGTLGVVTKVAIHCPVLPKSVIVGFFGLNSFEDVLKLYKKAKSALGEILSAFEMMDHVSVKSTAKNFKLSNPIPDYPFYVLIETHGSDEKHDSEKIMRLLESEMKSGLILDGTVASEHAKVQSLWKLRESIAPAAMLDGYMFAYDVSLPAAHYYELVLKLRDRLSTKATNVYGFGHVGDGNLHVLVTVSEYSEEVMSLVEPYLYSEVSSLGGSLSAEHGMGFRKARYAHYCQPPAARRLMRDLKRLMDPQGILNPYKVLSEDEGLQ